ncbi:hypothetical protein JVU11DRAFT_11695 [Chiua virens]|nr:hypothetical protein JVU11DRAFT_11695 [Chiua virens]
MLSREDQEISTQQSTKLKIRIPGRKKEVFEPTDTTNGVNRKSIGAAAVSDVGGTSDSEVEICDSNINDHVTNTGQGSTTASLQFVHYKEPKPERKRKDNLDESKLPTKKPRREIPLKSEDKMKTKANTDDKPDVRTFTVYISVFSTETVTEPKRYGKPGKTTTTTTTATKGPFKFDTSHSFADFQREVADALPCREALLPVSKFEWKFDKEAKSAPYKKIADCAGFDALVEAVMKTRVTDNVVIWLHFPKPVKEEDDWDTGRPDHVEQPFDFDVECDRVPTATMKGRIMELTEKRSAAHAALEKEYPVGNFPMFEGKRVWKNLKSGSYIELTDMRMKAWANALASGAESVTISAPPNNGHFSENKRMKVPSTHTTVATSGPITPGDQVVPAIQGTNVHVLPTGYPQPLPYHLYYPPHHMPFMPHHPSFPYAYPPGFTAPGADHSAMFPPPSPGIATTAHKVSLAEFCAQYEIDESDQQKLQKLEYRPGNRTVERLNEKDWREFAGFTTLGWESFLAAHRRFCAAIKSHNV